MNIEEKVKELFDKDQQKAEESWNGFLSKLPTEYQTEKVMHLFKLTFLAGFTEGSMQGTKTFMEEVLPLALKEKGAIY